MLKILEELIAILRLQSTITGEAVMDATIRHLADDAAYCAICDDKPSASRKISITQFNWSKTHRHRALQQLSPVHLTNHAMAQNAEWRSSPYLRVVFDDVRYTTIAIQRHRRPYLGAA
jgi:hypothetical protein